jgi:hypothetical protein
MKPTRRRLPQSLVRPHRAPLLCYSTRPSSQLDHRHCRTDHRSAHRAAGPLTEQLLLAGYLSAGISSGHRNGVAPLSTSARRCWSSRRHRGARRLGSGRTIHVGRHYGELRRGSRPCSLGRGRPASALAIRRLGHQVGCTVPRSTVCTGPHGYYATGPHAEVGPNGRVYFVSFRFRFKYAANLKKFVEI